MFAVSLRPRHETAAANRRRFPLDTASRPRPRSALRRAHCRRGLLLGLLFASGLGCNDFAGGAGDASTIGGNALTREGHKAYFPIEAGTKHAGIQCGDCHEDPTSFAAFTCVSCHAHAEDVAIMRHQYITGFQWRSNACVNCHPTGWEAAILPADHSLKYFPIQSGSHDTLLCIDCHTDSTTAKVFVCTTCHGDSMSSSQHPSVRDYAWADSACYRCHQQDR